MPRRHKCVICNKLSNVTQRFGSGAPWYCWDGCYSTTGVDRRTVDGKPAWEKVGRYKPWSPERMKPENMGI